MDGPGLSIFQGSGLKFNDSFQRAEEEELAEENRKRDAELQDLFQGAFDDLQDDDDSDTNSLASSHFSANQSDHEGVKNFNFAPIVNGFQHLPPFQMAPSRKENLEPIPEKLDESNDSLVGQNHQRNGSNRLETDVSGQHYKHCFRKGANKDRESDLMEDYKKSEGGGYDELKVLYEVRMREVERLRRDLDVEREAKEEAIHQLSCTQTERDKALSYVNDLKELISKSKDRIAELEESVENMKTEILELEKARGRDEDEVKISQQQVIQLEQRIAAMERCDPATIRIKQMDAFVENLNAKHQKEINMLQNKIDSMSSRLEEKDRECRGLESKLEEVERRRAALVLEKCSGASAARQESALEELLDRANEEKVQLNRVIVSLQAECQDLRNDLKQYENLDRIRISLNSSSDETGVSGNTRRSQAHVSRIKPASSLSKITNPHYQDLIDNLKDELQRALQGKKAKRHEINKLQEQVRSKELQIQKMKEVERDYLTQLDSLKGCIAKVVDREEVNKQKMAAVEQMRIEVDRLGKVNQEHLTTIENLNLEIQRLQPERQNALGGLSQVVVGLRENELAQLKAQSDRLLKTKESEWKSTFDLVTKECYEIKQLYMDLRKNNGKLNDQLELQKQHMLTLVKEKDHILEMLKEKESLVDKLKEENIKFRVEKEMNPNNYKENAQDKETICFLEQELEFLRSQLVELPKQQTKELEGLRHELEVAKSRLIDLDEKLKNEFQNEISELIAERDRLKDMIKRSNEKHLNDSLPQMIEIGVNTDATYDCNILMLKKEIDKLKDNFILKSDKPDGEKHLAELEDLEQRLVAEHKAELASSEERIKTVLVNYYTNHIEEMKKQFVGELEKVIAAEESRVKEFMELLTAKEAEIKQLKNSNAPEKMAILTKRIEEDRAKFTETIKQWSNQVELLKRKLTDNEKKITSLNQNLKSERRDVQKYKGKLNNALKRVEQVKLEHLLKIKSNLNNFKKSNNLDGKEFDDKIRIIEMEFAEKEKSLRDLFEKNKENRPDNIKKAII